MADSVVNRRMKNPVWIKQAPQYGPDNPEPGIQEEGFTDILNQVPYGQYLWSFLPGGVTNLESNQLGRLGRGQTGQGIAGKALPEESKILEGLPASSAGPNESIRKAAAEYSKEVGIAYSPPAYYIKANPERGQRIAQAYEEMLHDPANPAVQEAYSALEKETLAQFEKLKKLGLKIERIEPGMANPYPEGSKQVFDDIKGGHLWFYPTEAGFGSTSFEATGNPLLKETAEELSGKKLKVNDVFRIVHDVFGHAKEGVGFGPHGEENAWAHHMSMFSPNAQKALTSETRGQNSWVNFGKFGESNRANPIETKYADQKTGILPDWVFKERD